jgi:hypothetical protein
MSNFAQRNAALIFGALFTFSASAQEVSPGQMYSGPIINVRAPQSVGWRLIQASSAGMAFASKGRSADESYVAHVSFFPIGNSSSPEEFVALIRRAVDQDTSKQRFEPIDIKYEYTDQRGYPCVRLNSLVNDKKAGSGLFSRKELKMETRSLYCRHPKMQENGFAAIFSHRGEAVDSDLDAKAQSFIEGVQVPGHEPPYRSLQPPTTGGN